MKAIYLILGLLAITFACLGVVLPLLPTVPFLLLAAFFFARSSERLHHWLLSHQTFGPMIVNWQENRAISLSAKKAATLSVAAAFVISLLLHAPSTVLAIQAITLSAVMLFIWSRPSG